jgi:RNA polymerase sigma factor (sigma-70 family)
VSGINTPEFTNDFDKKDVPLDFKAIYEKYHTVILKHITYLTGNIKAAEDLTQEAFLKLYNSPPAHSNTVAWLSKVASNMAYNYLRDEKIKKNKEPAIAEDEAEKVILIEDRAIKNQEIRLIKKVLTRLPERDRICLLLKFSGYKYDEIAEVIGIEKTSVGTILARAQAKFKERYLKEV